MPQIDDPKDRIAKLLEKAFESKDYMVAISYRNGVSLQHHIIHKMNKISPRDLLNSLTEHRKMVVKEFPQLDQ